MNQESDLVPCYCKKCKGCPRAKRTERRHRLAADSETPRTAANQQADVPDFADWRKSMLRGYATKSHVSGDQSRNMGDDRDGSSSESEMSSGSSDNNSKGDRERPLKRRRVEMDQVYNPFY